MRNSDRNDNSMSQLILKTWMHSVASCFRRVLCGAYHPQNHAAVSLVEVEDIGPEETELTVIGDACPQCLEAGAAQRAREHAARLRKQAAALEELAGEVGQVTPWLSPADLESAERDARRQLAGGIEI
jgi:hypothetical protein